MGFLKKLKESTESAMENYYENRKSVIVSDNKRYVVRQIILKEALIGVGSTAQTLSSLETEINLYAECGYRLHTCSTDSVGSKGIGGGDRVQATLVFERIN